MLIRFFKSSFIVQYLALLILAVALWMPAFLRGAWTVAESNQVTPVYHFLVGLLPEFPWLPPLIGLLLLLPTALVLNNIFIYHDLVPKNSLLPAFLFVLFMSSSPDILTVYPVIIVLLPVTAFLHQAYRLYEQNENPNTALNLGILAALSSMISFPLILLVLYALLVYLIYRILNWRQCTIAIIGFILPYLYLVVYYFWTDQLEAMAAHYLAYMVNITSIGFSTDLLQISVWIVFGLLILLPAAVRTTATLGSQNINFRRKMAITVWLAVFGAATLFFQGDTAYNTLMYIPACGIVAAQFHTMKKSPWHELVLLAYLIMIGVNNYLSL